MLRVTKLTDYATVVLTVLAARPGQVLSASELAEAARAANLEPVRLAGMSYNPITERYALNQDTSVNYLMATRR